MAAVPVPLSQAAAILLVGETSWHPLNGSLGVVLNPSFTDPFQTDENGDPVQVTPGDSWVQFVDSATGVVYAAPFRSVAAVQLPAAQAAVHMPALATAAEEPPPQGRRRRRA